MSQQTNLIFVALFPFLPALSRMPAGPCTSIIAIKSCSLYPLQLLFNYFKQIIFFPSVATPLIYCKILMKAGKNMSRFRSKLLQLGMTRVKHGRAWYYEIIFAMLNEFFD